MKTLDRFFVYSLLFTILGLLLFLVWQKTSKKGDTSDLPKQRDLFNMKEYPQRQKEFNREINLEK